MEHLFSAEGGLVAVFAASLLAATVVPFSSEAVLWGFLQMHPDEYWPALCVATLGNTAGGMSTYLIGRLLPARAQARIDPRAIRFLGRWGSAATALGWLPVIGDGLCLAAGWLRCNASAVLVCMALGRFARYLAIASI